MGAVDEVLPAALLDVLQARVLLYKDTLNFLFKKIIIPQLSSLSIVGYFFVILYLPKALTKTSFCFRSASR